MLGGNPYFTANTWGVKGPTWMLLCSGKVTQKPQCWGCGECSERCLPERHQLPLAWAWLGREESFPCSCC